jgi:hypothetical protein
MNIKVKKALIITIAGLTALPGIYSLKIKKDKALLF